ncbi:MAG: VOC family protein [Gemmatimonadetes bacterium]|nr:VOC family protein [Gemmatimonadota bacterium]
MSNTTSRGRFLWHQLNTPNADAALAFYTAVCEWGRESWQPDPSQPAYQMWKGSAGAHSGVMQMPPDSKDPAHWLGYISTPDVDATVSTVKGLGGALVFGPMDIPSVGRFAVMTDPDGAMFAPFTPTQEMPPTPPGTGDFSWFELATRDIPKALAFYGAVFGWTAGDAMDMGPNGIYQFFNRDGQMMGGMYQVSASGPMAMPPGWIHYVTVADLNAAVGRVKAGGGNVFVETDIPGGRIAMCTDPQGAMFALHWAAA